jgi:hypothetical protein
MLFLPIILDDISIFQYSLQRIKRDSTTNLKFDVDNKKELEQNIKVSNL